MLQHFWLSLINSKYNLDVLGYFMTVFIMICNFKVSLLLIRQLYWGHYILSHVSNNFSIKPCFFQDTADLMHSGSNPIKQILFYKI